MLLSFEIIWFINHFPLYVYFLLLLAIEGWFAGLYHTYPKGYGMFPSRPSASHLSLMGPFYFK